MSYLSGKLAADFPTRIRERGWDYFRRGRVEINYGDARSVAATVLGSSEYETELNLLPAGRLSMWCSCAYFAGGEACKHLWAAVLAAEAKGYLEGAKKISKLSAHFDFDEEDFESEDFDAEELFPRLIGPAPAQKPPRPVKLPDPWKAEIEKVGSEENYYRTYGGQGLAPGSRLLYVVDVATGADTFSLKLEVLQQDRKRDGSWAKPKDLRLQLFQISQLPDAADRQVLAILNGSRQGYGYGPSGYEHLASLYCVQPGLSRTVIELAAAAGRCAMRTDRLGGEMLFLQWDAAEPWRFEIELARRENDAGYQLQGILRRGQERRRVDDPAILLSSGLVILGDLVSPLDECGASDTWIRRFRSKGPIPVPQGEEQEVLRLLLNHPKQAPLAEQEELRYEEVRAAPAPRLSISSPEARSWRPDELRAYPAFEYAGRLIAADDRARGHYDSQERRLYVRDAAFESAALERLQSLGLKQQPREWNETRSYWKLAPKKLPHVVAALVQEGWRVEAEGKIFRNAGAFRLGVSSGIDWFELHGEVQYGEVSARLPELLEAARRGEKMVLLGDGTYGILPEMWLEKLGVIANMGTPKDGHIQFGRTQAGLLDAMLAAQPEATWDKGFEKVREQFRQFEGICPMDQPKGFCGQLRGYQREGAGWMRFLEDFGFGGCLADDMGVGKTAQVLALLESRREMRARRRKDAPEEPSLVVAPRSLIFNWKQEAERFTPKLRVLDHTGLERSVEGFGKHDLILTTYGTMRRDIVALSEVEFDYVVLDEAQAIKNAATESAKAVRLLRGRNRLALSGTPVENHLGELWSLFEFLNPGMLGKSSVFQLMGGAGRNPSEETRSLLAHALRPFILRRTKQQVARELPEKTEQTIYCELKPEQRKLYNEMRSYFRDSLLGRIEKQGLAKSKMHVLEALLRLRQAACHPGLLDEQRAHESSAKLETLVNQLQEVVEEGHKALVFSQFASLLSIVRHRLESFGIVYEYLDGKTRDRQARVERFQNDPQCPVFLVSLKAGGLGLNLTAAEYVFLLDPWWNPAVEAQAVDRAHRIGQTRQVFAYRLIAKDTVEEKVLQLQNSKRDLAAAIITADNSLIRDLKREDLELLLS